MNYLPSLSRSSGAFESLEPTSADHPRRREGLHEGDAAERRKGPQSPQACSHLERGDDGPGMARLLIKVLKKSEKERKRVQDRALLLRFRGPHGRFWPSRPSFEPIHTGAQPGSQATRVLCAVFQPYASQIHFLSTKEAKALNFCALRTRTAPLRNPKWAGGQRFEVEMRKTRLWSRYTNRK